MMGDRTGQFRDILHTRYLSHVHTTFGGGEVPIEDYCRWAVDRGFQTIVFSEYVSRKMEYDFDAYREAVDHAREQFPSLSLWTGIETNVLPFGNLDIPEEILPGVDALFIACHDFPGEADRYRQALETVFRDERWKGLPRIWAHPGIYFKSREWTDASGEALKDLVEMAIGEHILIENNLREALPPVWLLKTLPVSEIIVGYGAHSLADLTVR